MHLLQVSLLSLLFGATLRSVARFASAAIVPQDIPNLVLWFDASDVPGDGSTLPATNTPISRVSDKSGGGRHFFTDNWLKTPTFGMDADGYFHVLFNGSTMSSAYLQVGNGGRTTFVVFSDAGTPQLAAYSDARLLSMAINDAQGSAWYLLFDPYTSALGVNGSFTAVVRRAATTSASNPSMANQRRVVATYRIPSASPLQSLKTSLNGYLQTVVQAEVQATLPLNTRSGGTRVGGPGAAVVRINECLHYDRELTDQEQSQVENYLFAKWSVGQTATSRTRSPTPSPSRTRSTASVASGTSSKTKSPSFSVIPMQDTTGIPSGSRSVSMTRSPTHTRSRSWIGPTRTRSPSTSASPSLASRTRSPSAATSPGAASSKPVTSSPGPTRTQTTPSPSAVPSQFPAVYVVGSWSSCSQPCDAGYQFRDVYCTVLGTIAFDDSPCAAAGLAKPASSQPCNTAPCVGVMYWLVRDPWSVCTAQCYNGTVTSLGSATRPAAVCVHSGLAVDADRCRAARLPMPDTVKPCNHVTCPSAVYSWRTSPWSSCIPSSGCGLGVAVRDVWCEDWNGNKMPYHLCEQPSPLFSAVNSILSGLGGTANATNITSMPPSRQACDSGVVCACSSDNDCVNALRSRNVHCGTGRSAVDVAHQCLCNEGWTGTSCNTIDVGWRPGALPACVGFRDKEGTCCADGRGIDVVTGRCCNGVLSRSGRCCEVSVDACGVCGGDGIAVDARGVCCASHLAPDGLCHESLHNDLDDCGVYTGDNACQADVYFTILRNSSAQSPLIVTDGRVILVLHTRPSPGLHTIQLTVVRSSCLQSMLH